MSRRRPRDVSVVVVGPDGAGKSTLARSLVGALSAEVRVVHRHWRPGLLPPPSALLRHGEWTGAGGRPGAQAPHTTVVSWVLLVYYWLDFLLSAVRDRRAGPGRRLVLVERGWLDAAVDPRRYRLAVPPGAVEWLGRLLPRPDLALVLAGPAAILSERKGELSPAETARQSASWSRLRAARSHVALDATAPPESVAAAAVEAVRAALRDEPRSWLAVAARPAAQHAPPGASSQREVRWWLPRSSRRAAHASLLLYHPIEPRGRIARRAALAAARAGAFRLLGPSVAPPPELQEAILGRVRAALAAADCGRLDFSTFAASRCNEPDRYVVLLLTADGNPAAAVKIAVSATAERTVAREADNLRRLTPLLPPPLAAPRILAYEEGVLALAAERWRPRLHPARLSSDVAFALGTFFSVGATTAADPRGNAHGDLAPWNLLRSGSRWLLVDWEHASSEAPSFHDVCHFLVHSYSLTGRPTHREIVRGLDGRGWVGDALQAYADGARIPLAGAPDALVRYLTASLDETSELVDVESRLGRSAHQARRRLLLELAS
jgi:energy-coupling factor transporter ATP-binding protein EcfA2